MMSIKIFDTTNIIKKLEDSLIRHDKKYCCCLFLVSFLIRLVYIFTIDHLPLFDNPTMDADHHHTWAIDIATKNFIGQTPFIRSPLYPYILGIVYKIFGIGFYLPRVLMAMLGAINVVLIYKVCCKLFSPVSALISAIIATFAWVLIFYDGELLITSVGLFFIICLVNSLLNTFQNNSCRNFFFLGLLFGLAALTRENYLPIIIIFFIFFLVYYWKKSFYSAIFLLGASLIIAPVTLRNYLVLNDFVPIAFYTGVNFYIGNNPYTDGRTAIVPHTRADWHGGVEDVIRIAQEAENRALKPSEISVYWSKKAIQYIKENPFSFIKNTIKKFFFVFDLRETSNNKNIYFFKDQSWLLRYLSFISAFLYIPFAILGMIAAIRKKEKKFIPIFLLLLGYILGLALSFVSTRLRHPIVGIFIIFAGQGIYLLLKRKNWKFFLSAYLLIFIFLFAISSKKSTNQDGYFTLANAYMRKNNLELSQKNYKKAIGLPEPYKSRINKGLADINYKYAEKYFLEKDFLQAAKNLKIALKYQENPLWRINLASLYTKQDPQFAIQQYKKAIALQPGIVIVYIELAKIYKLLQQTEELKDILKQVQEFPLSDEEKEQLENLKQDSTTLQKVKNKK